MRILFLTLAFSLSVAAASAQEFTSGSARVPLLELYTSEGCSSCPPADRWLSSLKNDQRLWKEFVPVSFHVDYWNYLGWDDRFAKASSGTRQRDYKYQGYSAGVYTPGVMLAGIEWRSWRRGKVPSLVSEDAAGSLQLRVDGERFTASFIQNTQQKTNSPRLHIALIGMGLKSEVRAGENQGKELNHDFVVLDSLSMDPSSLGTSNALWRGILPSAPLKSEAQQLAVAAWISDGDDLQPQQAVGGWLHPGSP
ncbi:MAG: DUF1223 domain-containing protein [Congregibacter sp.]